MRILFNLLCFSLFSFPVFAQIGIGNKDPKATLDISGNPSATGTPDGIIAPRINRADLIAKSAYTTAQKGAIVYITDLSGTNNASTSKITEVGYYYFDGSKWCSMNSTGFTFNYGDIKTGIQSNDHNGWIKLDGRATNTLTANQQIQALALGIGANIPNASNAVLVQNGNTLGAVSGSNQRTLVQNQLPNVSLNYSRLSSFTTDGTSGSSSGTLPLNGTSSALIGWTGNGRINFTSTNTNTTSSLNGDVTQQNLDITPKSMSVNTFIFLGD
jgi:hypothetical protein